MSPKPIVIHHTAVSRDKNNNQLIATDNYHKSLKFPKSKKGYYVGYHYFIEPDGLVVNTRYHNEVGAHTTQESMNYLSLGICLTGDFDKELPTDKQLASLDMLLDQLRNEYPNGIEIFPHRHFAKYKTCCGNNFTDQMIKQLNNPATAIIKEAKELNSVLWHTMLDMQNKLNEMNTKIRKWEEESKGV